MRNLLPALACLAIGLVLAVPGLLLAVWVASALYRIELAFDWAMWAAQQWPFPLTAPALQLANDAIQRTSLIATGFGAAFLCAAGFNLLRSARRLLRPADESQDGKARIVLNTGQPRVGRALEGRLQLARDANPGQVFRLDLSCSRPYRVGTQQRDERKETAFFARQDVQAVRGAQGWSLPFRFEIPVTAPPSGDRGILPSRGFRWRLAFYRVDAWIAFPSVFALDLAAAPRE